MHLSLADMARKTLGKEGETLYPDEVIRRSMQTTSEFPRLLQDFSQRLLRDSFQAAPQTWRLWTRTSVAKDFRPQYRLMISDVAMMTPINQLGEYQATYLEEGAETVQPSSYGQVLHISRQALVNDDLNSFSRIPEMISKAAENLVAQKVYELVAKNPVLKTDNTKCFDETHKNIMAPSAVSLETLAKVRANMRLQKSMKGQPLGLVPKYLITTPTNEVPTLQIINQGFLASMIEGAISQKVNPLVNSMEVIIEPRLESILGPKAWMVIADPSSIDTVEVCFLNGMDTVYLESQLGFSVDGISMKARLDFGASIIEYRGMHLTPDKKGV
jgi:hypothetical protein